MKYVIRDSEAGNVIESGLTKAEAMKTLQEFEQTDKEEGTYTKDFYEIVPMGFHIQDFTKQSGNNLLDEWAKKWDSEPGERAMWFETQEEANEFILKNGYSEFASVTEA